MVELDPVVVQLAREHFSLPESPKLQVRQRPAPLSLLICILIFC